MTLLMLHSWHAVLFVCMTVDNTCGSDVAFVCLQVPIYTEQTKIEILEWLDWEIMDRQRFAVALITHDTQQCVGN